MLKPRWKWSCDEVGCCVFVGGTDAYDIYMGKCHEDPYDPTVLLIGEGGELNYEFESQEQMHGIIENAKKNKIERKFTDEELADLELAANFVACFFPTPERVAMDMIAKGEAL